MSGIEKWTDDKPARRAYWKQPPTCDINAGGWVNSGLSAPVQDHEVTSWRGPVEVINIGNKKRRVHRAFLALRYNYGDVQNITASVPHLDVWCPAPGKVACGQDMMIVNFKYLWDRKMAGIHTYSYGSSWPLLHTELFSRAYNTRDAIVNKLFTKAYEPRWDGMVFIAELNETLMSIKGIMERAVKGTLRARKLRGLIKAKPKLKKALSKPGSPIGRTISHVLFNPEELWLWYRYFLLPAILDAEDLMQAVPPRERVDRIQTGRSQQEHVTSGTVKHHGIFAGLTREYPWVQTITEGGGAAFDVKHIFDPNPLGFSGIDVLRAAWERIPFSFVVDWFVRLGDFLTQCRNVDIGFVQSYATTAIDSWIQFNDGTDVWQNYNPAIHQVFIERIIDLEPPISPYVNKEWNSVLHTVDAISLAAGILKRTLSGR